MREGCWLPFHKHIYRKRLSMFFYSQALNFETIEHRKIYFCCDNTQISSEARWGDEKKWRQCYGVSSAPEPRETIWAALLDSVSSFWGELLIFTKPHFQQLLSWGSLKRTYRGCFPWKWKIHLFSLFFNFPSFDGTKLSVSAVSLILLWDFILFVTDTSGMLISLIPTPFDHFHFHASDGLVPKLILTLCRSQSMKAWLILNSEYVKFGGD